MDKRTGRFALGALIAAAAGYAAGVLTAPKSGKETRKDIKNAADKKITEIEKELKKTYTELTGLIKDVMSRTDDIKGSAKKETDELLKKATKAKDKVRVALSGVHDGDAADKEVQQAIEEAEKAVEHLRTYLRK